MKANELRIGNWVNNYRGNPEKMEASEISEFYDGEILDPSGENTFISAIPLTEEWLLKFGFVSNPYQDRYENEEIHVECNKTRDSTELWIIKYSHIKYIHSLQNLYFALTGKELEYEQKN
jgi:hypothetical protein